MPNVSPIADAEQRREALDPSPAPRVPPAAHRFPKPLHSRAAPAPLACPAPSAGMAEGACVIFLYETRSSGLSGRDFHGCSTTPWNRKEVFSKRKTQASTKNLFRTLFTRFVGPVA